ncbi:MAG: nitroreductase [Oscillospiraceae bacterium]|jgi:hypothetical protein|nr:nitroreductase [Oscillospiraceae bacterium]
MTIGDAMKARHSVRQYTSQPIEREKIDALNACIAACNADSGLHIQLITNEPQAFSNFLAHYGSFKNVTNYIALIGKKGDGLDGKIGYYGERVALNAQQLGLNTCWVALTYSKSKCAAVIEKDESLRCVLSLGYGVTQGVPHKNKKPPAAFYSADTDAPPAWFLAGMEAALLAPTARHQQAFHFTLEGNTVKATASRLPLAEMDLGIVRHDFEAAAGKENFQWA